MHRKVSGSTKFTTTVAEKFSLIYMEMPDDGATPNRESIWHLEDEERIVLALCGLTLKGTCKSVSPALAMLGRPCTECLIIVREYITRTKNVAKARVSKLLLKDIQFRKQVRNIVDADRFNVLFDEDAFIDAFPEWATMSESQAFMKKIVVETLQAT